MLKNYLKLAWKVLLRRRFFTFISLFGISFTLMVLMVITSLFDHAFGPQMPERKMEQLLFVNNLREQGDDGSTSSGPPVTISSTTMSVRCTRPSRSLSIRCLPASTVTFTTKNSLSI